MKGIESRSDADANAAGALGIEHRLDLTAIADPEAQQFIYLINQNNAQVEIIDRQSGKILSNFGRPGTFPGEFNQAHGIAVDSKNNVYIAENRGRRIQKFKIAAK